MTQKHTPGPWEARMATDPESGHGWWLYAPNYGAVGFWRGGRTTDTNRYWQLSEADACLIAAAPELLEALENFVEVNNNPECGEVNKRLAIKDAVDAIAKARGA